MKMCWRDVISIWEAAEMKPLLQKAQYELDIKSLKIGSVWKFAHLWRDIPHWEEHEKKIG